MSFVQDMSCEGVDKDILESLLQGVNCLGGQLEFYKHGVSIMEVQFSMLSSNHGDEGNDTLACCNNCSHEGAYLSIFH